MLLCDALNQATLKQTSWLEHLDYDSQISLGREILNAERLVLDDEVAVSAASVTLSKPTSLREALKILRVPYPKLWVEWREGARTSLLQKVNTPDTVSEDRPIPLRLGFLVDTDDEGRKGVVQFAWIQETSPVVAAKVLDFNFDDFSRPAPPNLWNLSLSKYWNKNPADVEAIADIYRTMVVRNNDLGNKWFEAIRSHSALSNDIIKQLDLQWQADVFGEYFTFISTILLLTAKQGTAKEPVSLHKLNAQRTKKGKKPLADHQMVHMYLHPRRQSQGVSGHSNNERGPVRAHMVRGHYVTRGKTIYWRRPHVRGTGKKRSHLAKVHL